MSSSFEEFKKACPIGLCLHERPDGHQSYKYYCHGKGCTLGVLFEDSVNVYYEWLREDDRPVPYRPEIRYKWWPKREFVRLVTEGVWEISTGGQAIAA